jgi:CRISPR-associated exonuclease Cas4
MQEVGFNSESQLMITPSEVIEHLYCPRFTYFMNCLNIPQHEELRYKVIKGREIHQWRERINRTYLWKKIGCTSREISVYLASPALRVRGIIDEILTLSDETMAPLDYKFTDYHDFTFKTHRIQSVLYGLLIEEIYKKPVKKGYICYVKGKTKMKEVIYKAADFKFARELLEKIFAVIEKGYYPKKAKSKVRCIDCCYKNICV